MRKLFMFLKNTSGAIATEHLLVAAAFLLTLFACVNAVVGFR
jgi:Flp pilus assembly pilin Flp